MKKSLKDDAKTIARELRPHALWDAIKLIALGGLAVIGVAVTAILQRLRGVPPDLLGIMILGTAWVLLIFVAYALGKLWKKRARVEMDFGEKTDLVSRVEILNLLDKWVVGWHQIVRGSVYPPESSVQVLVQPPNGCWNVRNAEVQGDLWTCNCEFGEKGKKGGPYKIVAVYGNPLKQEKYDDLPESLIKSSVIMVKRDSNEDIIDCLDKQLHQTKIADKSAINDLVMVSGIRFQKTAEGREPVRLDFTFAILNMSLHPITVDSIDGYIALFLMYSSDGQPYVPKLKPKLEKQDKALKLGFRQTGFFVIHQDFETDREAAYVLNASPASLFQFKTLNIRLTGDGLEPTTLNADISFSKKAGQWLASYEGDFIFAGLGDQKLAIEAIKSEHVIELEQLHADYDSRFRRTKKLSEVRGGAEQLLHAFNKDTPSLEILKRWAESLKKALSECYGLSGVSKFDDNRAYSVEVPEARSEQSDWLYMNWQRLNDLIKEECLEQS